MPPDIKMSQDQFQQLLEALKSGGGDATAAMLEMVKAQQRTMRQSNAYTPGISPFSHPEGEEAHPKARLDRETWFCATRADEAQMTPEEIEAFNLITTSKVWRGDPKFGADVTPKRRFIMLPHTSIDERMALPGTIPLVVRELLNGEDALDPIKMEQEIRTLKKEMAALTTKVGGTAPKAAATPTLDAEY